jgi:hypothetical protein
MKGGQPTTEVALLRGLRDDLYVVVGIMDPQSKRATLKFHVNPFVSWIWIGVLVLISGSSLSLWPEVKLREVGVFGYLRASAGAATSLVLALLLAATPARAGLLDAVSPSTRGVALTTPRAMDSSPLAALCLGAGIALTSLLLRSRRRSVKPSA